jgi:hypothetical protein
VAACPAPLSQHAQQVPPLPHTHCQVLSCTDLEPSMLQSLDGSALLPATSKASEHVGYCNQRAAPPFRSARSGLPLPESHTGQLSSVPMLCHPDKAAAAHHGRPGARDQSARCLRQPPRPCGPEAAEPLAGPDLRDCVLSETDLLNTHRTPGPMRRTVRGGRTRHSAQAPRARAPPAQPGARAAAPSRSRARST